VRLWRKTNYAGLQRWFKHQSVQVFFLMAAFVFTATLNTVKTLFPSSHHRIHPFCPILIHLVQSIQNLLLISHKNGIIACDTSAMIAFPQFQLFSDDTLKSERGYTYELECPKPINDLAPDMQNVLPLSPTILFFHVHQSVSLGIRLGRRSIRLRVGA
jgi:hypothetical protein